MPQVLFGGLTTALALLSKELSYVPTLIYFYCVIDKVFTSGVETQTLLIHSRQSAMQIMCFERYFNTFCSERYSNTVLAVMTR